MMQEYGETTEQQNAVGAWLCDNAESRQPFDKIKHRHTLKEVGDVAEGKYDWKIRKGQQGKNGFKAHIIVYIIFPESIYNRASFAIFAAVF